MIGRANSEDSGRAAPGVVNAGDTRITIEDCVFEVVPAFT